jgi:hypothetical protein
MNMKIGRSKVVIPRTGLGLDPVLSSGQLKDAQRQIENMEKKADSVHKPLLNAVKKKTINYDTANKIEKMVDIKAKEAANALIGFRGTRDNVRVFGPQDPNAVNAARGDFEKAISAVQRNDFQKAIVDVKKTKQKAEEDETAAEAARAREFAKALEAKESAKSSGSVEVE